MADPHLPPPVPTKFITKPVNEPFPLTRTSFKQMIIACVTCVILSVISALFYSNDVPGEITEYLDTHTGIQIPGLNSLLMPLSLTILVAQIWAFVSLYKLKSHSRQLLIGTYAAGWLLTAVLPGSVSGGISSIFADAANIMCGSIIALSYWSPAKNWFD
jgi:hypothetical protein